MTKLAYLPIDISNFHAYESDVKECSEIYDMKGVKQINKIHELMMGGRLDRHPIYSVVKEDDYHYLFLDRSEFKLATIEQVFTFVRIWIEEESIEGLEQYLNK
jgi:hypothetical protein